MKTLFLLIFLIGQTQSSSDITDLVKDSRPRLGSHSGDIIYKWTADINNDGNKEVFIGNQKYYKWYNHTRGLPFWLVYFPITKNSNYRLSRGTVIPKFGPNIGPSLPQIDPYIMYIGYIEQLGKRGIVTVQTDYPRNMPAISYIRAYTVEGDHLKETQLAEYDPTKGSNAIYEQYLSKAHRTSVKIEEITLK